MGPASPFRAGWLWLGLLGLAWGAMLAGVWALASVVSRRWVAGLPMVQVIAVLVLLLATPARQWLTALAHRLAGQDPAGLASASALLVMILTLGLLTIQPHTADWANWLPLWLQWLRPEALYRPLMLMPAWGVWAMMTPLHFCKPADDGCPLVEAFRTHQPVLATSFWMAVALAGTLWELNFLGGWMALPAAGGLLAGSAGAVGLCRTGGGLTRRNLLAGNFSAQLVFLLCYVAAKELY